MTILQGRRWREVNSGQRRASTVQLFNCSTVGLLNAERGFCFSLQCQADDMEDVKGGGREERV